MIEVIIVEYTSVNNTDRSQSAINVRIEGPVGDIISLVLAIPVFIIGVVMLAILFLSLITDYKTKDYIKAEATVTNLVVDEGIKYYSISYVVDGIEQTVDNIMGFDYAVGEKINIMYNPEDVKQIKFISDPFSFVYYALMVLFLTSLIVIIKKIKNIMHYINPQKYEKSEDSPYFSASVGNTAEDILDDSFRGSGTQFKL